MSVPEHMTNNAEYRRKENSIMITVRAIIFAALIVVFSVATSDAGWLIYHEPEFKGTILDTETKQPIEDAVVVAVYKKASIGLGAGSIDSIINVRETLTDKEGHFKIPSYTTFIQPFSWQIPTTCIIFKPGYPSVEVGSWHFGGEELKEVQERGWYWTKELKYKLRGHGIVELPRIMSREERRISKPSPVGEKSDWIKQKQFIKAIREEWRLLYGENPTNLYRWEDD
jgi:hypothetical protein